MSSFENAVPAESKKPDVAATTGNLPECPSTPALRQEPPNAGWKNDNRANPCRSPEGGRRQDSATPSNRKMELMTFAEFSKRTFEVEYLIEDVLAAHQPAILGGPKKCLKTSLLIDMALSLATATPFLGTFRVPRKKRVLLLSGESGQVTIQETLRRVCLARGLDVTEVEDAILWLAVPDLQSYRDLLWLEKMIRDHRIDVVMIDPLYLALPGLDDASNLFKVGRALANLTELSRETSATFILAHHSTKNASRAYAEPELSDLSWAGFAEWARQWLLLNRMCRFCPDGDGRHELWLSVGGSAGHSGAWCLTVDEGRKSDPGGRRWNVSLKSASERRQQLKSDHEEETLQKRNADKAANRRQGREK